MTSAHSQPSPPAKVDWYFLSSAASWNCSHRFCVLPPSYCVSSSTPFTATGLRCAPCKAPCKAQHQFIQRGRTCACGGRLSSENDSSVRLRLQISHAHVPSTTHPVSTGTRLTAVSRGSSVARVRQWSGEVVSATLFPTAPLLPHMQSHAPVGLLRIILARALFRSRPPALSARHTLRPAHSASIGLEVDVFHVHLELRLLAHTRL
jgi:hypothetical protein